MFKTIRSINEEITKIENLSKLQKALAVAGTSTTFSPLKMTPSKCGKKLAEEYLLAAKNLDKSHVAAEIKSAIKSLDEWDVWSNGAHDKDIIEARKMVEECSSHENEGTNYFKMLAAIEEGKTKIDPEMFECSLTSNKYLNKVRKSNHPFAKVIQEALEVESEAARHKDVINRLGDQLTVFLLPSRGRPADYEKKFKDGHPEEDAVKVLEPIFLDLYSKKNSYNEQKVKLDKLLSLSKVAPFSERTGLLEKAENQLKKIQEIQKDLSAVLGKNSLDTLFAKVVLDYNSHFTDPVIGKDPYYNDDIARFIFKSGESGGYHYFRQQQIKDALAKGEVPKSGASE